MFTTAILAHLAIQVFFFNDTATTEIYTLSLHDALPISICRASASGTPVAVIDSPYSNFGSRRTAGQRPRGRLDRKSTRLNSSHANISYAVFCLKKKKSVLVRQYI